MKPYVALLLVAAAACELIKWAMAAAQKSIVCDAFSYLRAARETRRGRPLRACLGFYWPGQPEPLNLPPLQILALVPFTWAPLGGACLLPMLEHLATGGLLFAFGWWAMGSALVGALAGGCYLLTPAASLNSASLTPRPLGVLLSGLVFLCAWFQWRTGSTAALAGIAAACAAALLAHRMTAQLLILVLPAWAIVATALAGWRQAALLAEVPAAMALAWTLSRGAYGRILADHWRRVLWHVRHGSQNEGRKAPAPAHRVIAGNPYLLLVAWLVGRGALDGTWRDVLPLLVFAGGAVLLSFAWIWGNGHRHVMFSAVPVALLVATLAPRFDAADWLLAGLCSAIGVGVVTRSVRRMLTQQKAAKLIGDGARSCMDHLSRQPPGLVLVLPNVAYPPLVYHTDHSILSAGHGYEALVLNRRKLKKAAATASGLARLLEAHPIDYVFVLHEERGSAGEEALWPWFHGGRPPEGLLKCVHARPGCAVYRPVRRTAARASEALACAEGLSFETVSGKR